MSNPSVLNRFAQPVDADLEDNVFTLGGSMVTESGSSITGDLALTGDITQTGDIALTGDLTQTGDIGLTGALTVSGATELNDDITLENDETISNSVDGTVQITSPTIKHAIDAAAYWTAEVTDGGGVEFAAVSDGTADFLFSQPVTVSDDFTIRTGNDLVMGAEIVLQEANVDGNNCKRIARGEFTISLGVNDTSGTYPLTGIVLPDNAIVTRSWVDVVTTFAGDGDDSSTLAITSGEAANDIITAVAIQTGTPWDAGLQEGIQDGTVANMIKMTAAHTPSVVLAIVATDTVISAGSMVVFVEYVVSI